VPLVWVTGVSGAGKSTVRRCLAERGIRAHDVDEDEFRQWLDKETDEPIVEPSNWHEPARVD
jgi:adenylylsulfate kinase-like enzyme